MLASLVLRATFFIFYLTANSRQESDTVALLPEHSRSRFCNYVPLMYRYDYPGAIINHVPLTIHLSPDHKSIHSPWAIDLGSIWWLQILCDTQIVMLYNLDWSSDTIEAGSSIPCTLDHVFLFCLFRLSADTLSIFSFSFVYHFCQCWLSLFLHVYFAWSLFFCVVHRCIWIVRSLKTTKRLLCHLISLVGFSVSVLCSLILSVSFLNIIEFQIMNDIENLPNILPTMFSILSLVAHKISVLNPLEE